MRFGLQLVDALTLAAATGICAAMAISTRMLLVSILGAWFGGFAFALYPLCVAHTNDHLEASERVGASGGLVLAYSSGAVVGPLAGAWFMKTLGPGGLYWFITLSAGGALLFGVWRQLISTPVPTGDQKRFQVLPRTSPMSASLDPESPAEGENS